MTAKDKIEAIKQAFAEVEQRLHENQERFSAQLKGKSSDEANKIVEKMLSSAAIIHAGFLNDVRGIIF